jgi:hypothetical protein
MEVPGEWMRQFRNCIFFVKTSPLHKTVIAMHNARPRSENPFGIRCREYEMRKGR